MKKIILYFLTSIFTGSIQIIGAKERKAVVIVPVADLVGQPLENTSNNQGQSPYHSLPWSCFRSHYDVNLRIHQLLFHEIVTVIKEKGDELLVEIPNVYFHTPHSCAPQARYWTHKNNLISIEKLTHPETSLNLLPSQYLTKQKVNTVVLIRPWYNKETGYTFSVGTKFIIKQKHQENVLVHYLHPTKKRVTQMLIPANHLYQQKEQSNKQKIKEFVRIAKLWANEPGKIPYVLGGCSYTFLLPSNQFALKGKFLNGNQRFYYDRPTQMQKIKTGLDCSGLIVRTAQIVGLPYQFKNTATLSDKLAPLSHEESLSDGDLIWLPGHVLIVSDVNNGLAIEAHSYDGGYGIVHEKPLHQLFKHIKTYHDLMSAYRKNALLQRLDKSNNSYLSYTNFKLLKLASIWSIN